VWFKNRRAKWRKQKREEEMNKTRAKSSSSNEKSEQSKDKDSSEASGSNSSEGLDDVEVCVDDDVSEDCANSSAAFSESSFSTSSEDESENLVNYKKTNISVQTNCDQSREQNSGTPPSGRELMPVHTANSEDCSSTD
jgi:hypothetical protein